MRASFLTLVLLLAGCQATGSGIPEAAREKAVSDAAYLNVIEDIARRLDTDMTLSNDCWIYTAISSPIEGNDENSRVNSELLRNQADTYNYRIRDLLAEGEEIPEQFEWVQSALEQGQSVKENPEAQAWLSNTERFEGLRDTCGAAFKAAAGKDIEGLALRALIQVREGSDAKS